MSLVPFPLRSLDRKTSGRLFPIALVAGFLAVFADSAIIYKTGPSTPLVGDAAFFASLGKSLAANHGYYLAKSPWPNLPHTGRAPLWPAVLSLTFRLTPFAQEDSAVRFTDAVLHGVTAALMVLLVYQVAGTLWGAGVCGAILALYPPEIALVVAGLSEPAFLAALLGGVILLLEGGRAALVGGVLCGLSVLARSNTLLLPVFVVALMAVFRPRIVFQRRPFTILLLCALFYFFPLLWMLRNYSVTGVFPLLSSMEGETLYGGNNARVANTLEEWGYWTLPDDIPGEASKQTLAKDHNEMEVNRYYHDRAMMFIKSNLPALPRLTVGKLVRGFVPIPWVPLAPSYVVFGARLLLYAAFAAAVFLRRGPLQFYTVLLAAMFLVTLTTTVIYYGSYRFTFCVEPFLLPFIANAYPRHRKLPKAETYSLTGK